MALLEVARIARAHGLRGEVVVELLTNRVERVARGSVLIARMPNDGIDDPSESRSLEVESSRPFQHRWLVCFSGITTREAAESLHGVVLLAEPLADADALFVHELIGALLVDQHGVTHGTVTAVQANPASDLLVVDNTYYVPVRFVTSTTPETVHVEVPDGLFE